MSVTGISSSSLATARATQGFTALKGDIDTLTAQLSTGKVATTYAGLGTSAGRSLALKTTLSRLDGYAANAADATNRLTLMTTGVSQIATLATKLAPALVSTATSVTAATTTSTALADLQTTVDILNTESGGRTLFSGAAQDGDPVASADLILNGDGTRAGLRTLMAERRAADLGTAGTGRLTAGTSGSAATLSEESPAQPFGMTLAGAASSSTAISASRSSGPPATATFAVATQPAAGDTVTATLELPDGSTATLTLTATTGAGGAGTFAIGATTADTAASLSAALTVALKSTASTTLASASALRTASDFFASSASNPPARVAGPPYDSATGFTPGSASDTVVWYTGDDRAGDPRATAAVQLGGSTSVAIGARANEAAFRSAMTGFAVLAASSFPDADPTSATRYTALASRVAPLLTASDARDSLGGVATDLSLAAKTVAGATKSLAARGTQLQDALSGIEDADPTAVATKLMATQTRLSASYQATAVIAKLTLADYL